MGTSTRNVAMARWGDELLEADPTNLVRELYFAENKGQAEPSGSQDMAGLVYPGINRLDYDFDFEGGYFPCHIESNNDPTVAAWLEEVIHILPVEPRPSGYNLPGIKNLDADWIQLQGKYFQVFP